MGFLDVDVSFYSGYFRQSNATIFVRHPNCPTRRTIVFPIFLPLRSTISTSIIFNKLVFAASIWDEWNQSVNCSQLLLYQCKRFSLFFTSGASDLSYSPNRNCPNVYIAAIRPKYYSFSCHHFHLFSTDGLAGLQLLASSSHCKSGLGY